MVVVSPKGAPEGSRAFIVSRVSTKAQSDEDKLSLSQQTEKARALLRRMGWVEEDCLEIGASGAKPDSEYFAAIDRRIQSGRVDVVLFNCVDRFARDVMEGIDRLRQWPKQGVHIYFGEQRYNPEDPDDVCMKIILLAMANHKREKNKSAADSKKAYVELQGRVYHRVLPPGFARVPGSKCLHHDDRAPAVARLWGEIDQAGLHATAQLPWVQKLLLPEPTPDEGADSASGPASPAPTLDPARSAELLKELIHNPLYGGEVAYAGELFPWGAYAIGDQKLLQRIRRNNPMPQATKPPKAVDRLETRINNIIESVGLARFLARAFLDRQVICRECHGEIRPNGSKTRGRLQVPQLTCDCKSGAPLVDQKDLDTYSPRLICMRCAETEVEKLKVSPAPPGCRIDCQSCGWGVSLDRSPWAPPAPKSKVPKTAHRQQRLDSEDMG